MAPPRRQRLLLGTLLLGTLLLTLLWPGHAPCADDEERVLTIAEAADVAVVLVRTRAQEMLRRLAARNEPDPWQVADELCARGEDQAARRFAAAAPRKDVEALPGYVRTAETDARKRSRDALAQARTSIAAGEHGAALARLDTAAAGGREDVPWIMAAYGRGRILEHLGRAQPSRAAFESAAKAARHLGWLRMAATAFHEAGRVAYENAELRSALPAWTRRLEVEQARTMGNAVAQSRANLALIHKQRGEYPQALAQARLALTGMEDAEDQAGVARTLANLGVMYRALGEYPKALAYQERAHRLLSGLGLLDEAARVLANQGNLYAELGDHGRAIEMLRRARRVIVSSGDAVAVLRLDVSLAGMLSAHGQRDAALERLNQALRRAAALHERLLMVRIFENVGDVQRDLGDPRAALASYKQALTLALEQEDREGTTRARLKVAIAHADLDERKEAVAGLEIAIREAERLRSTPILVRALTALASVHRAEGRAERALAAAKRAAPLADLLVRGQEAEGGARARAQYQDLYAVGALAAVDLDDAAELSYFLEKGRAGAFLEAFEAHEALRTTELTPDLIEDELRARFQLERRLAVYREARANGALPARRTARSAVEAARRALHDVRERIARHEKAGAGAFYPHAATLDDITKALAPDEMLVLYGLFEPDAVALVVVREGARIVRLGKTDALEALCAHLDLDDVGVDPEAAVGALRKALLLPLAIPAPIKHLRISPTGGLSYLPFRLLVEARDVAYIPSATTWLRLRDLAFERGRGVLALGDPDYAAHTDAAALALHAGGRQLLRLPATAKEAQRVGDVVLLGPRATKSRLRETLGTRTRWRAVHLACHGMLHPEEPMLSSLALTAEPEDDGFLSTSEVFRWNLPCDLAVLSGCETGKGKIYRAEGLVGLTRAFMFAGAPRVLCSLWRVDDDATQALMIRFYELWNPKPGAAGKTPKALSAAEALAQAQAFVRGQDRWKHPYYWAAWVLWGAPG